MVSLAMSAALSPDRGGTVLTASRALCGSTNPPASIRKPTSSFFNGTWFNHPETFRNHSVTVNLYVHVVYRPDARIPNGGMVTGQVTVLNQFFNPQGITFNHQNTSYTNHTRWATGLHNDKMKPALRKGDYRDLNLYFLSGSTDFEGQLLETDDRGISPVIGVCTFPDENGGPGSRIFDEDGCNVAIETMSGTEDGPFADNSRGKTAVHEVGHWFGLFHVFHSGEEGLSCDDPGDGDRVSDTAQQIAWTRGCPSSEVGAEIPDSCPDQPGADNIHNFMDYSDDEW